MRNGWLIVMALVIVSCISACSTANVGTVAVPDGSARNASFAVTTENGVGSFVPSLEVDEAGGQTLVRILAIQATDLEAAYVNLTYDSSAYSPDRVEISDFLGQAEDVLSLALTNKSDVVPIGIAQIAGHTNAVNGDGLLATVYFRSEPFTAARGVMGAPSNAQNAVTDLKIDSQGVGSVFLSWTERNVGDYDNNGEVSISDLTPIALLYGQLVAGGNSAWKGMVDGDHNGEINSADITPIGVNFGNVVAGYIVYTDAAGSTPLESSGCTCERSMFKVDNQTPVAYIYEAQTESTSFTVRPVDQKSLAAAGVISNVATIINIPGPPDAPTNLTATSDDSIARKVQLNWTASTHEDVTFYEIERKPSAAGDGAWANIKTPGSGSTSYLDEDESLEEIPYDYRVRAKDVSALTSDYSNVASVTPYFPPPPGPPTNLTSTNEIPTGNAIQLDWEAPGDGSARSFNVYCKGPADVEFVKVGNTPNAGITTFLHTDLTEAQTYEYYVKTVGMGGVESGESNTTSNTPSGAASIEITNLTTDKWTHYADGGDTTSATFTVQTSVPPDSVEWNCSLGTVTGSGSTVTYKPPSGSSAQVVTVTCTVHKGASEDSGTLKQYLTANQIYTAGTGGGLYFEVTEYPSIFNPNAPYMRFSSLFEGEGHVVIFTHWGTW